MNLITSRHSAPFDTESLEPFLCRYPSSLYGESLEGIGLDVQAMRRQAFLDAVGAELWSVRRDGELRGLLTLRHLDWDARVLGVPVTGGLALAGADQAAVVGLLADAVLGRPGLTVARVRAGDYGAVHALGSAGFQVMDTMNIVGKALREPSTAVGAGAERLVVESFDPRSVDSSATRDLAGSAFLHGRVYHDPRIPNRQADAFYAAMADSILQRADSTGVVGRIDGSLAGFVLGEVDPHLRFRDGRRLGYLSLLAVAPAFRGRGVARALLAAFECHMAERAGWLEVGTQTHNVDALNLYASSGYRFLTSLVTLHAWSD